MFSRKIVATISLPNPASYESTEQPWSHNFVASLEIPKGLVSREEEIALTRELKDLLAKLAQGFLDSQGAKK